MPVVELDIDSSGAVKGIDRYNKAVVRAEKTTESSFSKIESIAGKLAGALAAYKLGDYITNFAKASLLAASDMQETQGKFDVVFRNLGNYAEDAANRISNSYGVSRQESKMYLSSIQDLLVPTGIARDKAAEMSVAFVELASDLGSFNNMGTADVVRDLQSALAGSAETLTKYGIDVKAAAIEEEIMRLGLDTSTVSAERQAKAMALLSLAQKDSSDAIGDFARTQDSFANQTKIAEANLANLRVEIGEKILPYANQAITAFNEWITTGGRFNTIVNASVEAIRFLANGFFGLELTVKGAAIVLVGLLDVFLKMQVPIRLILAGLEKLGVIDSNPLEEFIDKLDEFENSAVENFGNTIDRIDDFNTAINQAKQSTEELEKTAENTAQTSSEAFNNMSSAAGDAFYQIQEIENPLDVAAKKAEDLANAEDNVASSTEKVNDIVKRTTGSIKEQAQEIINVASSVDKVAQSTRRLSDEMGGFDQHQRTSTSAISATGDSGVDFSSLSPMQQAALARTGRTGTSFFYHTTGSGQFSGGLTPAQRQQAQTYQAERFGAANELSRQQGSQGSQSGVVINNNFNQQVSRSDVETITRQQTNNEARQ